MKFDIEKTPTFNLSQTLNCGQVFRFREEGERTELFALGHKAEITERADRYEVECDDADFSKNILILTQTMI